MFNICLSISRANCRVIEVKGGFHMAIQVNVG